MGELDKGTVIGIGVREGTYYVTIEPPLTTDEIIDLAESGVLHQSNVEEVGTNPGRSVVEVDGGEDIANLRMIDVMRTLMRYRNERIDVYSVPDDL